MKKTVWIINQYASTLDVGFGGRSYFLAEELTKRGHRLSVFACSSWNLFHSPPQFDGWWHQASNTPFAFFWIKGITYTHAHSPRRVLNWIIFAWRLLWLGLRQRPRPDVIICSVQPLFSWPVCWGLARLFGARLILDVRDIWPLTLQEIGGYSKFHPMIVVLRGLEILSYRLSDTIISPHAHAHRHITKSIGRRVDFHFIANGFADVPAPTDTPPPALPDGVRGKFIVIYAGTVGLANALHTLIETAQILRDKPIAFVMIGEGGAKQALMNKAKSQNQKNVFFLPALPRNQIPLMLEAADILYLGVLNTPLYRYGIAHNKLSEYMNAARPVVFGVNKAFCPIEEVRVIPPEDAGALAAALLTLYAMPKKQRQALGNRGRAYARHHFHYAKIATRLEALL